MSINSLCTAASEFKVGAGRVQAFAPAPRLMLGEVKVADKSNGTAVIPKLFEVLAFEGRIATPDAMHTQRATAEAVTAGGGDYAPALKANPGQPA